MLVHQEKPSPKKKSKRANLQTTGSSRATSRERQSARDKNKKNSRESLKRVGTSKEKPGKEVFYRLFAKFKGTVSDSKGSDESLNKNDGTNSFDTAEDKRRLKERQHKKREKGIGKASQRSVITSCKQSLTLPVSSEGNLATKRKSTRKSAERPDRTGSRERMKSKETAELSKQFPSKEKMMMSCSNPSKEEMRDSKDDDNVERKRNVIAKTPSAEKSLMDWDSQVNKLKEKIVKKTKKMTDMQKMAENSTMFQDQRSLSYSKDEGSNVEEVLYPKRKPKATGLSCVLPPLTPSTPKPKTDPENTALEPTIIIYTPSNDVKDNNTNGGRLFVVTQNTNITIPFWMDISITNIDSTPSSPLEADSPHAHMSLNGEALLDALSGSLNLLESPPIPTFNLYADNEELEDRDEIYFQADMIFSNSLRSMMALSDSKSQERARNTDRRPPGNLNIKTPTILQSYDLAVNKTSLKDLVMKEKPFKESGKRLNSRA